MPSLSSIISKPFLYRFTIIFIILSCAVAGCSKARQKMKIPDIKMVTSENITAVSAPDERHVWIAGDYGIIFHSSDGGTTWMEQRSGVDVMLCDIQFIDNKTGWVVGGKGTLLATSDGGAAGCDMTQGLCTTFFLFHLLMLNTDGWSASLQLYFIPRTVAEHGNHLANKAIDSITVFILWIV